MEWSPSKYSHSNKRRPRNHLVRYCEKEKFMKKCVLFTAMILLVLTAGIRAQNQTPSDEGIPNYPRLPRVSAYEAYLKFKEGKAIIVQAGGEGWSRRHIMGAINLGPEVGAKWNRIFQMLPKSGTEIFTYCF
jgi:hypothetical protein